MPKKREIVIFYAWQSDSPAETNQTAIRTSLKSATNTVAERHDGLTIVIDDATRGMVGSGNVPDSIRLKIEACDIFVGDVTTITRAAEPADDPRPCPNPNVAFETGYAAAHIGWQRMIIVTNTAHGAMSDLPFDFDRQRVAAYSAATLPNAKKRKALASLMADAIDLIVVDSPKRPAELRALDPKQVRRQRDVANILWAMSQVSIARLDAIIENLPDTVGPYSHYIYENFHAVATSAGFHIYDRALAEAFRKLDKAWNRAFSYGEHYHHRPNGSYAFGTPHGAFPHPHEKMDYRRIAGFARDMRRQFDKLLDIIRSSYLEVDLDETDKAARERFKAAILDDDDDAEENSSEGDVAVDAALNAEPAP